MFKTTVASWIAASAALFMATAPLQAATIPVDTELQLLLDVSGSVDANEFALQRDGYVAAFKDAALQALMLDTDNGNRLGKLAVQLIYWSGTTQQSIGVAWTLIDSVDAANAFADAVANTTRPFSSLTAPGSAINFATPLFDRNDYDGTWVIDVSGDGPQNDGANTADARDAALAAGVDRINGLAIVTPSEPDLAAWYSDNIKGGPGSFVLTANNFDQFEGAIKRKLAFEATDTTPPIPLPASVFLLGAGLAGLGLVKRKRAVAA